MKSGVADKKAALRQTVFRHVITFVLLAVVPVAAQAAGSPQKSYTSPQAAVNALVAAVRSNNTREMLAILGPDSRELVFSGDDVADRTGREQFIRAYNNKNAIHEKTGNQKVLTIGEDNWSMPIPLVKKGGKWVFDAPSGKQEILSRRIGRNELEVMDVIHAYVDAQQEYAAKDCSGGGRVEFAQRLISTEGTRDGLYWEAKEGEDESPLGPLVARASREGYPEADLSPFHGYYFKILKGQGPNASGGAYNYVVKDRMILGFGLVAYPAEHGNSGVMTFIANQEGIIFEKNLGKDTSRLAEAMELFDPDQTWKKVEEPLDK